MKQYIAYALVLGLVWSFVSGDISVPNFVIGSILGLLIVRSLEKLYRPDKDMTFRSITEHLPKLAVYFAVLLIEITKASVQIARIILSPGMDIRPGIIAVPIRATKDASITAIANTISLTPGTLTIDVSDDLTKLYVHAIDVSEPEELEHSIRNKLEKYVLEAFE
jgi:multicomponent Na+:H+ antiporter subunit E